MSIDNKNIDKLFNEAAHSQSAPAYKSAYWSEMNAILNKQDAQRKGFIYWTLGGVLLLAILIPFLFTPAQKKEVAPVLYSQDTADTQLDLTPVETSKNANLTSMPTDMNPVSNRESTALTEFSNNKNTGEKITASNTLNEIASPAKQGKSKQGEVVPILEDIASPTLPEKNREKKERPLFSLSPIKHTQIKERNIQEPFKSGFTYKPITRIALYGKFSGGIMENYKTKRPFESGIMDLSLNVEFKLGHGLVLRTGLGSQFTTNADLTVSQRTKATEFQEKDIQTDLSYQNLYDLYIPIEFGYQYKRTSFGVGVQANYLVDTRIDVNRFEDYELVSEEKLKGAKTGLNALSTQGYVWVEQRLTKRLALGLKVGTNISGRIKNNTNFINESATTNPLYGQLTLRFDFIK